MLSLWGRRARLWRACLAFPPSARGRKMSLAPRSEARTCWRSCRQAAASRFASSFRRSSARGLTLVVSPLIALMRDQVAQLRELGVEAASLNSSSDADERRSAARGLRDRSLRLLYIAPERLLRDDVLASLKGASIDLLAIDEAHCVSQWGHDFRPEYLRLREVAEALGGVQTIGVTATADAPTRAEIAAKLFIRPPQIFVRSFDRPNLFLAMRPKSDATRQLIDRLDAHRGESGIVYCASRRRTEELAEEFDPHWPARAALPRRPRALRSHPQSGRLPARGRLHCLRNDRVRHGHRQTGRPLRLSCRHAVVDRSLLPGDWPRWPRRPAGGHVHALRRRRHRIAAPANPRERGAGRAQTASR